MKRILHYSLVLMIIAVISAGLLAYSNKKTDSIIKNISLKLENEARKEVFKSGEQFKEEEKISLEDVEYIPVYSGKKEKLGYVAKIVTSGYGGKMVIVAGIGEDQKIKGIKIIESRETPGLGDKILGEKWQKKWIGRGKNYEFNKEEDAFAGATISPRAVYYGLKKALNGYPENKKMPKEETGNIEVLPEAVKLNKNGIIKYEGESFIPGYSKDGAMVGCLVSCKTNGYNGKIEFDMGVSVDGKITGVKITKSSETGGIGGIIEEKKWLEMWKGRDKNYEFNEETDAEAGATTSPRAVYKEMNRVLMIYDKYNKK